MVGADADIVDAMVFQNALGELVARQGLHFVRCSHGVLAFGELYEIAIRFAEDRDVDRLVVAVRQLQLEEDQFWARRL